VTANPAATFWLNVVRRRINSPERLGADRL
jgi:hypothetical protein